MDKKPQKYLSAKSLAPDTGAMLKTHLKRKGFAQAVLARLMKRNVQSIWDYQKRASIQTSVLWELSLALEHNFFAEIAAQLPTEFPPFNSQIEQKDKEIEALKAEIAMLQREKELLISLSSRTTMSSRTQ